MSKLLYKIAYGALAVGLVGGCQTAQVEEAIVENSLPPAAAPKLDPVGTVTYGLDNGEEVQTKVIAQEGNLRTYQRNNGCKWTKDLDIDVAFGPAVNWENCGSNGSRKVSSTNGSIWPLEVGSSFSINATGTSSTSSSSWDANYGCKTVDQARITVAAGTFDTYKIKCSTPWQSQTIYYAPSVERVVKEIQYPKSGSNVSRYDWEFVRAEAPSS